MLNTITKLLGSSLHVEFTFYNTKNVAIVPPNVTFKYRKPDASLHDGVVTLVGTQHSTYIVLDQAGEWFLRWDCTGEYASAEEVTVFVKDTKVK